MNEQLKYEVIKSLVDHGGNKKAAALKLGCTTRHINRLIQKVHYYKGTKGLVIQTFDKRLLFFVNDRIYELDVVPAHEVTSKNFDIQPAKEKPQKRNIPSPKHPWRATTFIQFRNLKLTESMLIC